MEVMILLALFGVGLAIWTHFYNKNYDKRHPQKH